MRNLVSLGALLALAFVLGGCEEEKPCKVWTEVECRCDDGEEGTRLCL